MSSFLINLINKNVRLLRSNEVLKISRMASSTTIELGELVNDSVTSTFFMSVNSGHAFVAYELKGDNINLHSTEVPYQYRGQGIGGILAKEVFDYCVENNLKMKLTCEYLQKFYKDNPLPEYKKFVMEEQSD